MDVSLRKCSGSSHEEQLQLDRIKYCSPCILSSTLCQQYSGNINNVKGEDFCSGQAIIFNIILNIPNNKSSNIWDVPKSPSEDFGCHNVLLGKRREGTHFPFTMGESMKGALTGPSDLLKDLLQGYHLQKIIYHLDGGEEAQKYFWTEQITQAFHHPVNFDYPASSRSQMQTDIGWPPVPQKWTI
ncbi:hypothetical protein B0H14DRAFT_2573319 [Mycena olivaceomarginata]|nr:hypothetical protein B0H14DRAFT_2573319 [Mycena olivaceomarginata]